MEVHNKSLSVKFVKADYLCRRHTFKSYIILKKSCYQEFLAMGVHFDGTDYHLSIFVNLCSTICQFADLL